MQQHGQPIRLDGPERHLIEKKGTPTMGGVLILLAMGLSTLIWGNLSNGYVWATLLVTFGYGAIGFADDFLKLTERNTKGVSGRVKLLAQATIGLAAAHLDAGADAGPARDRAGRAGVQEPDDPVRLSVPAGGDVRDDGRVQRGEPDRRAGRAGDCADDDRGGRVRR